MNDDDRFLRSPDGESAAGLDPSGTAYEAPALSVVGDFRELTLATANAITSGADGTLDVSGAL